MKVASTEDRWRVRLIRYAPLFIWIGVILFLGSGQGSMSRTSLIIRPLLEFMFPAADEATLQLYHGYIRKLAHVFEYAVLALLALRAFAGINRRVVFSIFLVVLVASLDEWMQSFNMARTASIWDVLLDISGGLLVVAIFYKRHRQTAER